MDLQVSVFLRISVVLLTGFLLSTAHAAIYKWVQPNGTVVYTDRPPTDSATPADLPSLQQLTLTPSKASDNPATPTEQTQKTPPTTGGSVVYTDFHVKSPSADQDIRDNAGNVNVELTISPELQAQLGHHFVLMLDGKPAAESQSTEISLANIDRGSHDVAGVVVDSDGTMLATTETVTFSLQRYSAINPTRAAH